MKKIKRLLTIGVAVALMFCMSLSFVGCKKEPVIGPIPDGKYANNLDGTYVYVESNDIEFYWKIEGDNAVRYTSGYRDYKAKIVQRDEKIYFECYEWIGVIDIFATILTWELPTKRGCNLVYIVDYNAENKSISFALE